ncbi:MAG: hypothetical protein JNJ58_12960 [Chitinophagaceae bacterium]|nr:hypothetical protein [Chitinophagaceae bacterium]
MYRILMSLILFLPIRFQAQTLNYYFGNLHAHSSYSDGNQDSVSSGSTTPADDFNYAQNSMCMDFLGISDHNHNDAGMLLGNYQLGLSQAAAASNSNFLALYGMEWGTISTGGHVLVYGVDSLIGWDSVGGIQNYDIFCEKGNYSGTDGLFRLINRHGNNAFATLAHPDPNDFNNLRNTAYSAMADSAIVGSAIANGPAFSLDTTYSNPPSSLAHLYDYNRYLANGYFIGASMDNDNHNTTFGRASQNRLVVLSPSLSPTDFFQAIRSMHFYASEDFNARVSFTLNGQMMGSIINGNSAPEIHIAVTDTNAADVVTSIQLYSGVQGSGILPVVVASSTLDSLNFSNFSQASQSTRYYYAIITISGKKIVTSPIWYTRTNNLPLPLKLISFTGAMDGAYAHLQWKTQQEENIKSFELQRSSHGASFSTVGTYEAAGFCTGLTEYEAIDRSEPILGSVYYRLKVISNDDEAIYSDVIQLFSASPHPYMTLRNNPVYQELGVQFMSEQDMHAGIQIVDMTGRICKQYAEIIPAGGVDKVYDLSLLAQGYYVLKVKIGNELFQQQFLKM